MKSNRTKVLWAMLAAAATISWLAFDYHRLYFFGLPFFNALFYQSTNCGGNTAALFACKMVGLTACTSSSDASDTFNLQALQTEERAEISRFADYHWTTGAHYLLRTNFVLHATPRQIIVVCEHRYSNVPQPNFWNLHRKTPAHAVAYSDGSTGLISPAEFKKLDLSGFLDIARLKSNVPATALSVEGKNE
jgi:hypothetical protein